MWNILSKSCKSIFTVDVLKYNIKSWGNPIYICAICDVLSVDNISMTLVLRFWSKKNNIWNVNCARATAFIFDTRIYFLVKVFETENVSTWEGLETPTFGFMPNDLTIWAIGARHLLSHVLNTGSGGIDIFEVKLTFEMLTVRGQQHSFSTHEWVFLWKCQSFGDRKCDSCRMLCINATRVELWMHDFATYMRILVPEAGISGRYVSNCILQFSVGCNYLSMSEMLASGSKVLIFGRFQSRKYHLKWCMCFISDICRSFI